MESHAARSQDFRCTAKAAIRSCSPGDRVVHDKRVLDVSPWVSISPRAEI
jgi:hypothetical protein